MALLHVFLSCTVKSQKVGLPDGPVVYLLAELIMKMDQLCTAYPSWCQSARPRAKIWGKGREGKTVQSRYQSSQTSLRRCLIQISILSTMLPPLKSQGESVCNCGKGWWLKSVCSKQKKIAEPAREDRQRAAFANNSLESAAGVQQHLGGWGRGQCTDGALLQKSCLHGATYPDIAAPLYCRHPDTYSAVPHTPLSRHHDGWSWCRSRERGLAGWAEGEREILRMVTFKKAAMRMRMKTKCEGWKWLNEDMCWRRFQGWFKRNHLCIGGIGN